MPTPASSSSLFVAVIVQVACCTRWNSPALQLAVSGEAVDDPAPQLLPLFCSSQNRLNLLRVLAWIVTRASGCTGVCDSLKPGGCVSAS